MRSITSASVLICTYNRAALLRRTLAALQAMAPAADYAPEIIVVDNNSTDETRAVVGEFARAGPMPVRYLQETRQGKSYALNTGLSHARSDVLALTDDDVLPAPDWLNRIVGVFREHDVTFVFGKVLPLWSVVPPPELLTPEAQAVWGPLAILDYGDLPTAYTLERVNQRLPIGANLAFVRDTLVRIGGWRTDLGKVNNTLISGEDHEIFLRLRRQGQYAGYYDPEIVVRHHVPASRLTRRYFRRWFFWHGKTHALMLSDLFPEIGRPGARFVAGVPRFLYREALLQCWAYLRSLAGRDALMTMIQELVLLRFAGLFVERWRRVVTCRVYAGSSSRTASASEAARGECLPGR